jgi:hypothetical protein
VFFIIVLAMAKTLKDIKKKIKINNFSQAA